MVKVIFYKAHKATKNKWLHKLIAWRTKGPYSHCEFYFTRSRQSFSSDIESNKCRFKIFTPNPENWTIIDLDLDDYSVYLECKKLEGAKYDLLGIIFNFILPINIEDRKKYFCSEVIVKIAQNLGYDKLLGLRAHKTDPNKLYRKLTNG
jgi:hypothetical protein